MSESNTAVTQAAGDSAADTAAADAAAAAAAAVTTPAAGADAADPAAGAAADPAADPDPKPKPKRTDRHIAHLTARTAAETARADEAERRAAAAEALLRAGKPEGTDPTPTPGRQPAGDLETRAAQLVAEREFIGRLGEIDASGKKDLGPDAWEAAKATMTSLGAAHNQAFLQALAETENPAKIYAALADDPDALMGLLTKPPAAMAARLGRMDADLSKPNTPKVSNAPKPAAKVEGTGTAPAYDLHNYPPNMPMSEYVKLIDAALPPHLGGRRKTA